MKYYIEIFLLINYCTLEQQTAAGSIQGDSANHWYHLCRYKPYSVPIPYQQVITPRRPVENTLVCYLFAVSWSRISWCSSPTCSTWWRSTPPSASGTRERRGSVPVSFSPISFYSIILILLQTFLFGFWNFVFIPALSVFTLLRGVCAEITA